jgi:hypothetical protein
VVREGDRCAPVYAAQYQRRSGASRADGLRAGGKALAPQQVALEPGQAREEVGWDVQVPLAQHAGVGRRAGMEGGARLARPHQSQQRWCRPCR